MGETVVVDTNIWAADEMEYPDAVNCIAEMLEDDVHILMPTIVEMELMSYFEIETDPIIKENREGYVAMADTIVEIDSEIAQVAGELRRLAKLGRGKAIKGPDALIAAVALIHNAMLVSNNDGDFEWIQSSYTYQGRTLRYTNPIDDKEHYKNYVEEYKKQREL